MYRILLCATKAIQMGEGQLVWNHILYLKEDPPPIFGAMGVLLNGVNIFGVGSPCGFSSKYPENGGPSKYVDVVDSEGHTTDQCGGHITIITFILRLALMIIKLMEGRNVNYQLMFQVNTPNFLGGYLMAMEFMDDGKVPTECGGYTHIILM